MIWKAVFSRTLKVKMSSDRTFLDKAVYRKRREQFELGSTAFGFTAAWIVARNAVVRAECGENGYHVID